MKNATRFIALALIGTMVLGLTACGASPSGTTSSGGAPSGGGADGYSRTEVLTLSFAKLGNDNEFDNQRPPAHQLKRLLEEYSGGMIQVEYFPGGVLGNEGDMLDQVISGDLDIGMFSNATFSSVTPETSIYTVPFLFESNDEFYAVACLENGNEFATAMADAINSYGQFRYITPFNGLFRALSNRKHPVAKLSDLSDLNMRVQPGVVFSDSYAALGASTASIAFAELYNALQQGAVDGEDCSFNFYYAYKFYELEPYTTEMRMFYQTVSLVVSNDCWDNKFTEEDRELFMKCATEAEKLGWEENASMEAELMGLVADTGVDIVYYDDMSEDAVAGFRAAVQPIWEQYEAINPELWATLQKSLAEYRAKK